MNFLSFLGEKNNLLCFSAIAVATMIIEVCIKKKWLSFFIGRKILHVIAITICAYCIYHTSHTIYLSYLFLAFAIILSILVYKKLFASSANQSYGIALFPLAFFVLLQMPFLHIHTVVFSVLTLAFADAAAGYIGSAYGKNKIVFFSEEKSWVGFAAFYIVTLFLYLKYFSLTLPYLGLLIALVPALVELFSYKGSDNFTVPIITALWFYLVQVTDNNLLLQNCLYLAAIFLLAIIAYYKKWLSVSGAAAAFLVGAFVIFYKDVMHLIPLGFFLLLGTLLSKMNKEASEARNARQVFANGFVAVVVLLIYYFTQNSTFHIAYFLSIGISLCDTASSEIGKYYKGKTVDITTGKPMAIGLSGGISWQGTIGGLLSVILYVFLITFLTTFHFGLLQLIILLSMAGMIVDSILGSIFQAKYVKGAQLTETKTAQLAKGFHWVTNDLVNIVSNIIIVVIYLIMANRWSNL